MQKRYSAILVDDQEDDIIILKKIIERKFLDIKILNTYFNVDEAFDAILDYRPEIIFLDIDMPRKNGFDLINMIRKNRIPIKIIVVSSSKDHGYKAIKSGVFDYLTKPVNQKEIENTVQKIVGEKFFLNYQEQVNILRNSILQKVKFSVGKKILFVKIAEIVYCKTHSGTVILKVAGKGEIFINETLKQVQLLLPPHSFFKINKSTLINLSFLKEIHLSFNRCILDENGFYYKLEGDRVNMENLYNLFNYV